MRGFETPEAFADFAAAAWDPFGLEREVLRAADLNEATWEEVCAFWRQRFVSEPLLALRFGDAYAQARARAKAIAGVGAVDPASGFMGEMLPFRSEAAKVRLSAEDDLMPVASEVPPAGLSVPAVEPNLDGTIEIQGAIPSLRLPFHPAAAPTAASLPRQTPPSEPSQHGGTAELPLIKPKDAFPFATATAPARRLLYFNPQTGEPLSEPIWEGIATSTSEIKK